MTPAFFIELGRLTLFAPRRAAAYLLGLRLTQQWLWMALVLMIVLNAIAYSLSLYLSPPAPQTDAMPFVPPAFQSPVLFALFLGGGLVVTVLAFTWVGRAMGGKARVADVLVLVTWMQLLRLVVQVLMLVLMLALPGIAALLVIVASVWGLVILVGFLDVAHGFESIGKTVVMLILSTLAMVLVLSLILGVVGVTVIGGNPNV